MHAAFSKHHRVSRTLCVDVNITCNEGYWQERSSVLNSNKTLPEDKKMSANSNLRDNPGSNANCHVAVI